MLPKEFLEIYDDTTPEKKEIHKKIGKKVSSVKSYSCSIPMFEDIRRLNSTKVKPRSARLFTNT